MSDKLSLFERRRRLITEFYQTRAAIYARSAATYLDRYNSHIGRFFWDKRWLKDQISHHQVMAEIYSATARMLMGAHDE